LPDVLRDIGGGIDNLAVTAHWAHGHGAVVAGGTDDEVVLAHPAAA
jgi:hypothetical protein